MCEYRDEQLAREEQERARRDQARADADQCPGSPLASREDGGAKQRDSRSPQRQRQAAQRLDGRARLAHLACAEDRQVAGMRAAEPEQLMTLFSARQVRRDAVEEFACEFPQQWREIQRDVPATPV